MLPPEVLEYVVQGARDGRHASPRRPRPGRRVRFRPRVLRDVTEVDTSVHAARPTAGGAVRRSPPTTLQRAVHPDGELRHGRAPSAAAGA